ncbi:MAG: penicillin-binding protein [Actinomycetota bacterium]|nr:penicillin-binding protein [Actinomycetota bacterium]
MGTKILLGLGVFATAIAIAGGVAAGWVLDTMSGAPSIDDLKPLDSGENSQIFAADGTRLGFIDAEIVRERVGLRKIPKTLEEATIAIEDEHFYEHSGVDYQAIVRAFIENTEAGETVQGASTITQQLVRNLYIKKPEDTIERKLIEAQMAMDYEERYTKKEILEQYLNTATYGTNGGDTAVGVEAASQVYFNKSVDKINLGQAALLAGLPQAPSQYNPLTNAELATQRRNLVLRAMREAGFINGSEYSRWSSAGLQTERGVRYEARTEPYFFDYVQQELIDEYGTEVVRTGGLKVYTTIEPKLQQVAREAIAANYVPPGAAAALVSTDAETGEIKAMASSSSYTDNQFNLAAQGRRQPGSAFKPFALTAAVDQGADPDSTFYSAPSSITLTPCTGCPPWPVSGGAGGSISLRQATAASVNTVYAQLVLDISPEAMDEMATNMGITAELNNYPAEVLGALTYGVSVLEMSNAYATLANGGVHHEPTAIRKVEFLDGEVDEPNLNKGERVISDGVAYTVADVMKGALQPGGTAPNAAISCPASGKTGTTEAQADVWFVGYTPHVSTAVWMGNPNDRTPMPGYGADLAAPIWQDYMEVAATEPCEDFPEPTEPASLGSFYGDYTVTRDFNEDDTVLTPEGGTDTTTEAEPDDAYAPGLEPDANPVDPPAGENPGVDPGGGVDP